MLLSSSFTSASQNRQWCVPWSTHPARECFAAAPHVGVVAEMRARALLCVGRFREASDAARDGGRGEARAGEFDRVFAREEDEASAAAGRRVVAAMGTDFAPADINGDGLVNTADVLILQGNYGLTCE